MIRTGYLAVDLVMVGVIIFQGWNFASNPNFINAANSIALLGIAAIGAWQATKAAARDKIIVSIKKTAEATHILSNSAMGEQLKTAVQFATSTSVIAHRLADLTKEAGDAAYATATDVVVKEQQALLQKHLTAQAVIDAQTDKDKT
jgi:ribose/xylose/arabinose/galactoside ABC-type transport system permease subunit